MCQGESLPLGCLQRGSSVFCQFEIDTPCLVVGGQAALLEAFQGEFCMQCAYAVVYRHNPRACVVHSIIVRQLLEFLYLVGSACSGDDALLSLLLPLACGCIAHGLLHHNGQGVEQQRQHWWLRPPLDQCLNVSSQGRIMPGASTLMSLGSCTGRAACQSPMSHVIAGSCLVQAL